jgi:hypothetical protein
MMPERGMRGVSEMVFSQWGVRIRRHKIGKSLLEFAIAMICALHAEL